MALDLGLTTYQLLSALDGVAPNIQSRRRRLDDAIDRALAVAAYTSRPRTTEVAGALRLMLCERFRFLVRGAYDSKAGNAHRPTGCRVHARPQLCQSHPVSRRQSGLPAWRLVYFCVLAYYGGVSNSDCRMPTRGQC